MSVVTIGRDRILQVDGKPFFPLAARHMPEGGDYERLRSAGFNAVRWTPFGMDGFPSSESAPPDFGGLYFYPYLFTNADLSSAVERRRRAVRDLVAQVRDRADLLCYEQRNSRHIPPTATAFHDPRQKD